MPASTDAVIKTVQVATTGEAARYAAKVFEQSIIDAKLTDKKPVQEVLKFVKDHADYVTLRTDQSSDRLWRGLHLPTAFEGNLENSVSDAVETFKATHGEQAIDMTLDIAVSDQSELLRGYPQLDDVTIASMDKLFNALLARNNGISEGGYVYEGTTDGKIKLDEHGHQLKMKPEKIWDVINKFPDDVKERIGSSLTVQKQPFPEEGPEIHARG